MDDDSDEDLDETACVEEKLVLLGNEESLVLGVWSTEEVNPVVDVITVCHCSAAGKTPNRRGLKWLREKGSMRSDLGSTHPMNGFVLVLVPQC